MDDIDFNWREYKLSFSSSLRPFFSSFLFNDLAGSPFSGLHFVLTTGERNKRECICHHKYDIAGQNLKKKTQTVEKWIYASRLVDEMTWKKLQDETKEIKMLKNCIASSLWPRFHAAHMCAICERGEALPFSFSTLSFKWTDSFKCSLHVCKMQNLQKKNHIHITKSPQRANVPKQTTQTENSKCD